MNVLKEERGSGRVFPARYSRVLFTSVPCRASRASRKVSGKAAAKIDFVKSELAKRFLW